LYSGRYTFAKVTLLLKLILKNDQQIFIISQRVIEKRLVAHVERL
jgi:hypothetical protein